MENPIAFGQINFCLCWVMHFFSLYNLTAPSAPSLGLKTLMLKSWFENLSLCPSSAGKNPPADAHLDITSPSLPTIEAHDKYQVLLSMELHVASSQDAVLWSQLHEHYHVGGRRWTTSTLCKL